MLVGISRMIALAFLVGGLAFGGDDAKALAMKLNAAMQSKDTAAMVDMDRDGAQEQHEAEPARVNDGNGVVG